MRLMLVFVLLAAACGGEADRRVLCTKYADENLRGRASSSEAWVAQCVKERWSPRQMECNARAGGFDAMFCD